MLMIFRCHSWISKCYLYDYNIMIDTFYLYANTFASFRNFTKYACYTLGCENAVCCLNHTLHDNMNAFHTIFGYSIPARVNRNSDSTRLKLDKDYFKISNAKQLLHMAITCNIHQFWESILTRPNVTQPVNLFYITF